MMNRRLCLLTLAIVLLSVSMGSVQACINLSIKVTPNGTVSLNTTSDVAVHYDCTDNKPAAGILVVWYRPSLSGSWTPKELLLAKIMPSPYDQTVKYTFKTPGYYKFTWTILKTVCESETVCARVGPVLPEPGTLLGLAVSAAALGLVFGRKRLTK